MLKVLLCHNYYQQPGGEDLSFESEAELLRSRGHEVITYTAHNDVIRDMSKLAVARKTIWNSDVQSELTELIRRERPDIMHCTNTFPLLSPAAYSAARAEGVAVVQSLRNYRLICPGSYFLRDGKVCEKCLGKALPLSAIRHGCYRGSRSATTVVTAMLGVHNLFRTWSKGIDLFFAPSEFTRQKFLQAGFPADRVVVKPNFVDPDPGAGDGSGNYAVFVGRLSPEKDLKTLLAAWQQLGDELPLKVVGDGPLAEDVKEAQKTGNVEWLGRRPLDEVLSIVGNATTLVMPSVWYETFGRTIVEAFAKGTPVITSDMGAMAELVEDGRTGLRFKAGDVDDLVAKVRSLVADRSGLERMRQEARKVFETRFTAARNYDMLIDIYNRALGSEQECRRAG